MIKELVNQINSIYMYLSKVKQCSEYKNRDFSKLSDTYGYIPFESSIKSEMNQLIISYLLFVEGKRKINWIKYGFLVDYLAADSNVYYKDNIADFIKNNRVFRKQFRQTVPYLYSAFIETNNKMIKREQNSDIQEHCFMACELYELYKSIGKYFLECDGNKIELESIDRYLGYLAMLESEIKSKLDGRVYEIFKGGTVGGL